MTHPIPVLLYHHIGDKSGASSAAQFNAHLNWLSSQGYQSLSWQEFSKRLAGEPTKIAEREFLLTFDDGYADVYDTALAILQKYQYQATAFLITDKIGQSGYLDWASVIDLQHQGDIAFHSHSHRHCHWQSEQELAEDLSLSRKLMAEQLKLPASYFSALAWPWGICNQNWETLARETGFTTQFLVQTAAVITSKGSLRLPRLNCDAMPLWRFKTIMQCMSGKPGKIPLINRAATAYRHCRGGFGYD